MEEVQAEVEQAGGDRLTVDQHVPFGEVPAARPHQQRGGLVIERVLPPVGRAERERPADGVLEVDLALDDVRPPGTEGVLDVGHEHARPGVQRVDHHLALDRAGDLDASIEQVRRSARHHPRRLPNVGGVLEERRANAGVQFGLAVHPATEQRPAMQVEPTVQAGDELQRLGGQDPLCARDRFAEDLDAARWRQRVGRCLGHIHRVTSRRRHE